MDVYDALDLTQGEKKVYKALVKLKSTTTGPLYKHSGVSQSKVYEILERLKNKGLAASIIKNNTTHWHPANPNLYLEKVSRELKYIKDKKEILEKELPHLLKEDTYPSDDAQVLVGFNGFKSCLYSLLDSLTKNDELKVLGSPIEIPEPFYSFLASYNKERVNRNIHAKFLYGDNLKNFAKSLYTLPKTKLRFLKGLTPSTIAIGPDRIIIMTWENNGKFVIITGKEIASSYSAFFESLWNMSEV